MPFLAQLVLMKCLLTKRKRWQLRPGVEPRIEHEWSFQFLLLSLNLPFNRKEKRRCKQETMPGARCYLSIPLVFREEIRSCAKKGECPIVLCSMKRSPCRPTRKRRSCSRIRIGCGTFSKGMIGQIDQDKGETDIELTEK